MSKHSAGPWYIGGANLLSVYSRHGIQIAVVTDRDGATSTDKANAELMAAAPDMLKALEKELALCHCEEGSCEQCKRIKTTINRI